MANEEPSMYDDGTPVFVEPGLELAMALCRVLAEERGAGFGEKVRTQFETRLADKGGRGGDDAVYADAARKVFGGFDWSTFTASSSR